MARNILLVEDDPFLVDIYIKKLQQAGFNVSNVDSGEEALKVVKETPFDLVLLDIVVPDLDGWEILKQIKSPEAQNHPKVIVFSNLGQKSEVEKGIQLGADKYLIKANYTPTEVIEEVRKALS